MGKTTTTIAKEFKKKCALSSNKQGAKKTSNKIHCKRQLTQWWETWGIYTLFHTGPKIPKGSIVDVTYTRTDTGKLETERCTVKEYGYNWDGTRVQGPSANEWCFEVDLCKGRPYRAELTVKETGFKVRSLSTAVSEPRTLRPRRIVVPRIF